MLGREQRLAALEKANLVRAERAALLGELAELDMQSGLARVSEWLGDPPSCLESMRLLLLLRHCTRVGDRKAETLRRKAGVSRDPRIGDLTRRERLSLQVVLPSRDRVSA
jgi:hypothetical protein